MISRVSMLLALCVATAGALAGAPACARESSAVRSDRATVSLVSDTDAVAPGQPFRIGLRLVLAPGWHTYWKNPGDAGVAPEFPLSLPAGSTAGPVAWPTPARLAEGPVSTYAYTGDLLLPVTILPGAILPGAGPQRVSTHARWLVCERICVPEEGDFTLDLPPGTPAPSPEAPLFAAADRATPRARPFEAAIAPDGVLSVRGPELREGVKDAWFLPDTPGVIGSTPQTLTRVPGGLALALPRADDFRPGETLSGVLVVVEASGEHAAFDIAARPAAASAAPVGLARMLALAFGGGLLLNLMPCVFPVLAMKALAFARAPGRRAARTGALFYTAGVLAAFSALGAALVAARAAGGASGWGFQFQSPAFVAVMAWVLFAVGLNMSGVFQLSGGRLSGAGQGLAARGGATGSFFTGLLAVVVATPCTAPFMGAAIAAALAAPLAATMLVFVVMGMGLAAPYAALALIPGLGRLLPRPGAWMDVFKQAVAFPMYAAAAWLVWVVSAQSGSPGVLIALAGLVLIGLAAWASGLTVRLARSGRLAARVVCLAAIVAALALLPSLADAPIAQAANGGADGGAEAYSPARLAALRAEGRPVFVNLTAAWCVTCLVNERVALSPDAVRRAFADHHVAYLKGDWTRADPAVTALLRQNDRDGVPLYLFYAPGAQSPDVLPQILTPGEILGKIARS